jgi:hypothetical protein
MNKGVQILLERIKSNPEEFTPDIAGSYPLKWRLVLRQIESRANGEAPRYLDFLSDAEIDELWRAMRGVRGDQFTKEVMNTLLSDGELSSFSQGLNEGQNLEKLLEAKKARTKQKIERELNRTFEQVYENHPVYGTPR